MAVPPSASPASDSSDSSDSPPLSPTLLNQLAALPTADAPAALDAAGLLAPAAAIAAAQLALEAAAFDPARAEAWLPLLDAWISATGGDDGGAGAATALLDYARARLALEGGDFAGAEQFLLAARERWRQLGDELSLARSGLGLTQLLAQQGRMEEAEATIRAVIVRLGALQGEDARLLELDAQQNLGTLLSYAERHAEAQAVAAALRDACLLRLAGAADPAEAAAWQVRLGGIERDLALACTYLDQPQEAETLLLAAIQRLSLPETRGERGQARTNLGHLYTRLGRYAEALAQLDAATIDLLGTLDVESAAEHWAPADVLFLEQGVLYLALNLLPEAAAALGRAEGVLRVAQQPYELGQALYYRGVLLWRQGNAADAASALDEAAAIYAQLGNAYWLHRVQLAQAALLLGRGDPAAAAELLDRLPAEEGESETDAGEAAPLAWDQISRGELHLLRVHLRLAQGDTQRARESLAAAAHALGLSAPDADEPAAPTLHLRLLHAAGLVERGAGNGAEARRLFGRAVDLAEAQRGLLPIEELRAAFLGDKTAIYADLLLSLLDAPQPAPDTPAPDLLAAAFEVVERARSRALLERLLSAVDAAQATAGLPAETGAQIAAARSRLAWLYNQLLGPGVAGSRKLLPTFTAELAACEATLQRLEWQAAPWLQQVQPATLAELQGQLAPDQAALVYFAAGEQVLAFVVTRQAATVVRDFPCAAELDEAQAQWRFQLGRVEIGGDYVQRRQERLIAGARAALGRLHSLLIAPLLPHLAALAADMPIRRLLVIPCGSLHLLPFGALWDGERYLLEAYEIAYTPSASLLVHRGQRSHQGRESGQGPLPPLQTLGGLALPDGAIPQAEEEVRAAARHFDRADLYVREGADSAGLQAAAAAGDVLHIATHGVFRPDNPFFSALKLADGWIDVRAIYRLPLAARLVVLSACESGAVQVQGSEEAIGLSRGFLGAGAQSLVVSLWNVHDASAAILMDRFYAALGGDPQRIAGALRAVQREAAAAGRHPYYWGPYVVIGGWRGDEVTR